MLLVHSILFLTYLLALPLEAEAAQWSMCSTLTLNTYFILGYSCSIEDVPGKIHTHFIGGEHTVHHRNG